MLGDVFVVRREWISLKAEWADPYSCSEVDITGRSKTRL